jgi:hypothetical protein
MANGGTIQVIKNLAGTFVVDITAKTGQEITVYSDAAKTEAVEMPDSITATKAYYLKDDAAYEVSVTINDVEIAAQNDTVKEVLLDDGKVFSFAPTPSVNTFLINAPVEDEEEEPEPEPEPEEEE